MHDGARTLVATLADCVESRTCSNKTLVQMRLAAASQPVLLPRAGVASAKGPSASVTGEMESLGVDEGSFCPHK